MKVENQNNKTTEGQRKRALEDALNRVVYNGDHAFMGNVLQCMNISYTEAVPTAGVMYDKKLKNFKMFINPDFFCNRLNEVERGAVLLHEFYHILHKHVFMEIEGKTHKEKQRYNIAMDLAINQLIKGLPNMAMTLDKFRDKNGKQFQSNLTTQHYYELLLDGDVKMPEMKGQDNGDGEGDSESQEQSADGQGEEQQQESKDGSGKDQKGKSQQGKGKGGSGSGDKWMSVEEWLNKQSESPFDSHDWDKDGDPANEKEKMEAISDLFKRAMVKSNFDYSQLSGAVRDFLEEIKSKIEKLNYKQILLSTLKKSMPSRDSKKTWKRPSRRYGELAKGNMADHLPKIEVLIDTSGSISMEEANEFLNITNNFMTVGVQTAMLNLFHTETYYRQKIKKNHKLNPKDIQSGGTDLTDSFQKILKNPPDLLIILTDGYWELPRVDLKKLPEVVTIISRQGTPDHPLKKHGKTVKYA